MMAGESWKSPKNTALEWAGEPLLLTTEQIMQVFRDGYARGVDPGVARQQAAVALAEHVVDVEGSLAYAEANELYPEDLKADGTLIELRFERDNALLELERLDPGGVELTRARADQEGVRSRAANAEFLEQDSEAERLARLQDSQRVEFVPPPVDPQYRLDADHPSVVVANTRVVPAETVDRSRPASADTARFEMQLAIAQQVAVNQVRAQQQADAEAAERLALAALGQYIAPPSSAPARNVHR